MSMCSIVWHNNVLVRYTRYRNKQRTYHIVPSLFWLP